MKFIRFSLFCFTLLVSSFEICRANNVHIKRIDGSKIAAEQLTHEINEILASEKITGLSTVVINDNRVVYQN